MDLRKMFPFFKLFKRSETAYKASKVTITDVDIPRIPYLSGSEKLNNEEIAELYVCPSSYASLEALWQNGYDVRCEDRISDTRIKMEYRLLQLREDATQQQRLRHLNGLVKIFISRMKIHEQD
jgi:hypothetical protein